MLCLDCHSQYGWRYGNMKKVVSKEKWETKLGEWMADDSVLR